MRAGDLTTVSRVKQYLPDVTNTTLTDALLARMVSAASAYIQTYIDRQLASKAYVETRNGNGAQIMMLKNAPVTAVSSLSINGLAIAARAALSPTVTSSSPGGYVFDENSVMLEYYEFSRRLQNIQISYTAGYLVVDEAQTIPDTPGPYTLNAYQFWAAVGTVVYASTGVAFTKVTGTPAAGEYSVDEGEFTFAAADKGLDVLLTYPTVPADVEQACIEMICDRFKYRDRIGVQSKSIEGQNISFSLKDLSDNVKTILVQYKRVALIQ